MLINGARCHACARRAAFDTDGSGTIDRAEMGAMVAQLGLSLSEERIDRLMADADPGGSGDIDYAAFARTLRQQLADGKDKDTAALAGSLASLERVPAENASRV